MSYSIGPKIYIDGEAEFRSQIKKINTEYKALEAETKALTAAMDANGDEQGKLEGTAKQLEKQIDLQRKRMALLEDAVKKASDKYGESSLEATRLRGALFDTQATVTTLENKLQDTNDQLNRASEGMEELEENTEGASDAALDFSDIVGANFISDIAVEALDDLKDAAIDFAKGSLDAASDARAMESQFTQTFGEMKSSASDTLSKISKDTGIAVTRMQGDFTKLYAFTKTAGADSAAALDISGRALSAAADSAAYYDRSIEDTTESLMSFLKGNYENDAALGISATETTRNAKANEMYAVSFDKLSESQKVDVLLAMVEAGNAASGALGQAAREADSWTNVQGELNESLDQMQAALGEPFLQKAIPIIQDITAAIYDLTEKPSWQKLDDGISSFTSSMEDAQTQFSASSAEIELASTMAELYVGRLGELEAIGLDTAESQREYANIVEHLNALYPDLNLQIDEHTGLVNKNRTAILADIDAMKQKALYIAMEERYTAVLSAQADASLAVTDAESQLVGVQTQRDALLEQLTDATGLEADTLIQLYNSQMMANTAMADSPAAAAGAAFAMMLVTQSTTTLTQDQMALMEQVISLNTEESSLKSSIEAGNKTIEEQNAQVKQWHDALEKVTPVITDTTEAQDDMSTSAENVTSEIDEMRAAYVEAYNAARSSIDSQVGLFRTLATESSMSAREIVDNWMNQKVAFDNYTANMQAAIDMGLDEVLVQQLSDGSEQSMLILDELVNSTDVDVTEINESFQSLNESKDTATAVMAGIRIGANEQMDQLIADSKTWGPDIVDGAVGGLNAYSYKFTQAMSSIASFGNRAFRAVLAINSPSGVMEENLAFTIDGAVLGVEKNIQKFTRAMENLGVAGNAAFIQQRIDAAQMYPDIIAPVSHNSTTQNKTVNCGGNTYNIYQRPGESAEDLLDRLQILIEQKEAAF